MTMLAPDPVVTSTPSPAGTAAAAAPRRFRLSPLNQRRWQNFKANRRGYWSLPHIHMTHSKTLIHTPHKQDSLPLNKTHSP